MGTVIKRGSAFRAIIRRVGAPVQSKTFDTRRDANEWMHETEKALKHRKVFSGGMTLGEVLIKFRNETVLTRPDNGGEHCLKMLGAKFANVEFAHMSASWWVEMIRGLNVAPVTASRYLASIRSALHTAETDYGISVDWESFKRGVSSAEKKKLLGKGRARKRVFRGDEYQRLIKAPCHSSLPMVDLINFAIDTCMRRAEILRITWADFDKVGRMQMIRKRKHPTQKSVNDQEIPLLGRAVDIINRQPRKCERIFPYKASSLTVQFQNMCMRARIEDFHFHDLRHVGITALFEQGFSIQDVAMVSGHSDWRQLKAYVVDKPSALHLGPDRHRRLQVAA